MPLSEQEAREFSDNIQAQHPDEQAFQEWLRRNGVNPDFTLNDLGNEILTAPLIERGREITPPEVPTPPPGPIARLLFGVSQVMQDIEAPLPRPDRPEVTRSLIEQPETPAPAGPGTAPAQPTSEFDEGVADVQPTAPLIEGAPEQVGTPMRRIQGTLSLSDPIVQKQLKRLPANVANGLMSLIPRTMEFLLDVPTFYGQPVSVAEDPFAAAAQRAGRMGLERLDEFIDRLTVAPANPLEKTVQDMTTLTVGTAAGSMLMRGLGIGRFAQTTAGGALADVILTDPDQPTLISQIAGLPAPIQSDILWGVDARATPEEVEAELVQRWQRRKWATVEGAIIGTGLEGVVSGYEMLAKHVANINASRKVGQATRRFKDELEKTPDSGMRQAVRLRDDVEPEVIDITAEIAPEEGIPGGQPAPGSIRGQLEDTAEEVGDVTGQEVPPPERGGSLPEDVASRSADIDRMLETDVPPAAPQQQPRTVVRTEEGQVIPNPEQINQAEDVFRYIGEFINGFDDQMLQDIITGQRPLSQFTEALRAAKAGAQEAFLRALREARETGTAEANQRYLKAYSVYSEVLQAETQVASEIGRSLNIFGQTVNGDITIARAVERKLRADVQNTGVRAEDLSIRLLNMNEAELEAFVKATPPTTIGDVLQYVMWNSLLSSPRTDMISLMGNTFSVGIMQTGTRFLASAFRGQPQLGMRMLQAYGAGWSDIMNAMTNTWRTGEDVFGSSKIRNTELNINEAFNIRTDTPFGRGVALLGHWSQRFAPVRRLAVADTLFKMASYRMELYYQAALAADKRGFQGDAWNDFFTDVVNNPHFHPDIDQLARQEANVRTFANHLLDPTGTGFLPRGQEELATVGTTRRFADLVARTPVVNAIAPFIRISVNSADQGLQHLPAMNLISRQGRRDFFGEEGPDRQIDAYARTALGTMMMLGSIGLASTGVITGRGPRERKAREVWEAQGNRPYTFNGVPFENDSTMRLVLGTGADIYDLAGAMREDPEAAAATIQGLAATLGESMTQRQWQEGLTRPFEILGRAFRTDDPERQQRAAGQIIANLAPVSAFTRPAIVRDIREVMDPVRREMDTLVDRIANAWPGWSETLPPKLNRHAEPVYWHGAADPTTVNGLVSAFFPFIPAEGPKDPGDIEALRLGINLQPPGDRLGELKLTPEQEMRRAQLAEQPFPGVTPFREALNQLVETLDQLGWSDERRIVMIENLDRRYKTLANRQLRVEFPELGTISVNPAQTTLPGPPEEQP